MAINLFSYSDYRSFIKDGMSERSGNEWGTVSRLSEAMQCQRSHISRVLSGEQNLTIEQAVALAEGWQLLDVESDYFILLVESARAGTPSYRNRIQRKIRQIQADQENLAKKLGTDQLEQKDFEALYYSAWYWVAIHVLTSIPKFQQALSIAQQLQLPLPLVEFCLAKMQEFGLVQKQKEKWIFGSASIHLPKSSPFISIHHQNWRGRAVLDAQAPATEGVHYTVLQSFSQTDAQKLKHLVLQLIENYHRIADPSKGETLFALNCDFFQVG